MDDAWLRRLDVRPEGSAFADYAKLLRLLSGMSQVGLLRALARARQRKSVEEQERSLRSNPAVVEFTRFLEGVPKDDLPIVLSVVSEGLFPNGSPGWFTTNCPDPRVSPAAALSHVRSHMEEAVSSLAPLGGVPGNQPAHPWADSPVVGTNWADELVQATFSDEVLSAVRSNPPADGLVLPSQCLFKIKVEVFAEGHRIAMERYTMHKNTSAENLVRVIKSSFSGLFDGVHGTLFENLNKAEVSPEVILHDALPDVTKLEYRVDWNELIQKHGMETLSKILDLPEDLTVISRDTGSINEIRLDLKADDLHLVSKKLLVPAKARIGDVSEAVVSGFDGLFEGVPFEMKLEEGGDPLDPQALVSDIRPPPNWLVFGVSLERLVTLHGEAKIRQIFPTATSIDSSGPPSAVKAPGLLEVCVQADSYVISRRQVHVPGNGTAEDLIQCVSSTFGPVLSAVRGYLATSEGQPVARDTDLVAVFPGVLSYTYHVSFEELLRSAGPEDIGLAFPDAECLKDIDRFPELKRLFDLHLTVSKAHESSVPVASVEKEVQPPEVVTTVHEKVRLKHDEADLGAGAPTSKSCPTPHPLREEERDGYRILQVKLFIQKHMLMVRYERVSKTMIGKDLKLRLWDLLPSQYRHLDCEIFVGGTHFQLSLADRLSENLRPTEVSLDLQLLVDQLSSEELATVRAVCSSALAPYDAAAVAPKSPVGGPRRAKSRGRDRSVSPRVHGRPVFGDTSGDRVPPSFSESAKRPRRSAMANEGGAIEPSSASSGGFKLHYVTMPALSEEQNSYLANLAKKVSKFLHGTNVVRMATIFERGLEDPLMFSTPFLDQSLRGMSAKWKLPLLTFGDKWSITLQADPGSLPPKLVEVRGDDATLFLQVIDLETNIGQAENRSRRRSRSHRDRKDRGDRGDRGSRRRRRDTSHTEERDQRGRKCDDGGDGRHTTFEGGKKATSASEFLSFGGPCAEHCPLGDETQLWSVGPNGIPCRQRPSDFDDGSAIAPGDAPCDPLVPKSEITGEIQNESQLGSVSALTVPFDVEHVKRVAAPKDDVFGSISATAVWTQKVAESEQHGTSPPVVGEHLEAVLSDILLRPVPYSSGCGKWLKAYPLIVQSENFQMGRLVGSGDQSAYMVRFGSHDFCHSCFALFPFEYSPTTCPCCGVSCVPPVHQFIDTEGSLAPELRVLRKYVPRPQDVLGFTVRCTVEGVVGKQFGRFLRTLHVEGFSGPNGSAECFLLWEDFRDLAEDCQFALFNGLVVGVYLGKPIFGSPFPGSHSALIRRPHPHDETRFLDLFAGLGGWECAVGLLSPDAKRNGFSPSDFVSVEIDPTCARVLALNTQRAVAPPGSDLTAVGDGGVVIHGDVCDPDWYHLSLAMPFTDVLWSAPCQPWSLAGNAMGFSSDLGLLLAHAVGLLYLFRPLRAFGENVAGLHMHPQWARVKNVLAILPHHLRVQVTDLKFLSPMCRKRLFIMHQLCEKPQVAPHVDLKPRHWTDTGCGFLNEQLLDDDCLTETQKTQLSTIGLLPPFEKAKAVCEGLADGPFILLSRLAGPILPTLVASYRAQCELPLRNLREKGLLTWLVSEDIDKFTPRYLDVFEAQRVLGFPFTLTLPEDPNQAMHLLGNAVSPVQGAVILFRAHGNGDLNTLRSSVLHRLYRQPPLSGLRKLCTYGMVRLGVQCEPSFGPNLSVHSWHVCLDAVPVACVTEQPPQPSLFGLFSSAGRRLGVASCRSFLLEEALAIFVKLQRVQVVFLSEETFHVFLSPLCALVSLGPMLEDAVLDFPGSLCDPLWMFNCAALQVQLAKPLEVQGVVRFIFGDEVRVWTYQAGVNFRSVVDYVFPFGISHLACIDLAGRMCPVTDFPAEGAMYTVTFHPFCVEIAPFGFQWIDPLTTVGQLADFLAWKHFYGRAVVRIVVNGKLVDPARKVSFAAQIGVMRAKVFALPGGAKWTLTSILVEFQTLLVSHGLGKDVAESKAHQIYDTIDHNKSKAVLDNKNPWAALKAESTRAKIVLIPLEERANSGKGRDGVFENDPWANWKEPEKTSRARRPARSAGSAVAKVDFTFFHSNNNDVPPIALNQLLQGVPGLLVTNLDEMKPHLGAVTKNKLSVGAAGVLFLGATLSDFNLGSSVSVENCIVPGWIGQHPSAIQAVLLNCGDEPVQMKKSSSLTVPLSPSDHQVVQYHVYKDTCTKWDLLVQQGFEFFVKAIGFSQVMAISQSWAQGFFVHGKKVAPDQAVYCHGYCKLESKCVHAMLRLGGFEGFFPCPRSQGKTSDPFYRVLQLRGFSLADSRAVLPQDAFGLTRGKSGYGLRVAADKYAQVKKTLFPDAAVSSESDSGGASRFHLLGVPPSVDRSALKVALRALKWPVRVSRSSGFKAWVVFSAVVPPTRSFPLDGETVVVIESSNNTRGPVVASSGKNTQGFQLRIPESSQPVPLEISGEVCSKYDQLAKQADQKVNDLEAKMQSLATKVEGPQAASDSRFKTLEDKVQVVGDQIQAQSKDLDAKLETMFDRLFSNQQTCLEKMEKTSELAISGLRNEYQQGYSELKELLSQSPTKARKTTP